MDIVTDIDAYPKGSIPFLSPFLRDTSRYVIVTPRFVRMYG